jgi:hypothetical protein
MKPRNNKIILSLVFAILLASGTIAEAGSTANVTATVTVQNISVSVSDGTITYGTLGLSDTEDTTTAGINDSQTATNDGNITEDLNIKGQNSTAWTLSGSVGANQYKHEFCTTTCDATPVWTALTTSYQTVGSGIAAAGTRVFDLKLSTPSTTASYTQQSVDVIVQAVAP